MSASGKITENLWGYSVGVVIAQIIVLAITGKFIGLGVLIFLSVITILQSLREIARDLEGRK